MRAGLITGKEQMEFREFPFPEQAQPGAVVVAISKCGICGSDVSAFKTGHPYSHYLSGHEWSGTVVSIGDGVEVEGLQVGDRVTRGAMPACGHCRMCRAGVHDRCPQIQSLPSGRHPLAPQHGAYAERIQVPGELILQLPDNVSDDEAAMIEPASVAIHAVRRQTPKLGDTAVVFGGGAVGLFAAQLLRLSGASQVVVIEPIERRRNMALQLGVDAVAAPGEEAAALVDEVTDGLGADLVFECAGAEAAFLAAAQLSRPGGTIMVVGVPFQPISVSVGSWLGKELTIDTSLAHLHHEFPITLDLIASGRLKAAPIHDLTISLDELPDMLRSLAAGEDHLQVIVDPRR